MKQPFKMGIATAVLIVAVLISGCSQLQSITGKGKNPPDEFAVVKRPPLIVPPEFELAPPDPGEPTPQDLASAAETLRALFPDREGVVPVPSKGEESLLRNIEAGSLPKIRSEVGNVNTPVVEKGTLLDEIIQTENRDGSIDGSDIQQTGSEDEGGN